MFQVGYFRMVTRSCTRMVEIIIFAIIVIASLIIVFGSEWLFGRADIGALIVAIMLCTGCIIYWDRGAKEILLWIRATIWGSVWRAARYF